MTEEELRAICKGCRERYPDGDCRGWPNYADVELVQHEQSQADLISKLEDALGQVKRERVFTGSGLYGFMNGGAEQFLEYGVSRLTARDVVYKGEDYTLENYEITSQENKIDINTIHIF